MPNFRIVKPDDEIEKPEVKVLSFEEQARADLEQALSEGAMAIWIIYETEEQLLWRTIPSLDCVRLGLIKSAADRIEEMSSD